MTTRRRLWQSWAVSDLQSAREALASARAHATDCDEAGRIEAAADAVSDALANLTTEER